MSGGSVSPLGAAAGAFLGGPIGMAVGGVNSLRNAATNFINPKPAAPVAPPTTLTPSDPNVAAKTNQAADQELSIRGQAANMLSGGGQSLDSTRAPVARNVLLGS